MAETGKPMTTADTVRAGRQIADAIAERDQPQKRRVERGEGVALMGVRPLDPIAIPGVRDQSSIDAGRLDDILVAVDGGSVFIALPLGDKRLLWDQAKQAAIPDYADVGPAHDMAEPNQVRQVFEIPRSRVALRWLVRAAGIKTGADIVRAIKGAGVAACPDQRTLDYRAERDARKAQVAHAIAEPLIAREDGDPDDDAGSGEEG